MEKFTIAKATINDNEVSLVKQYDRYFIYWGEPLDNHQSSTELLTPSGRIPSQTSAHKKFIQAVKAAKYLKFSKL
jgi:hypothetical protein